MFEFADGLAASPILAPHRMSSAEFMAVVGVISSHEKAGRS
jgi:hypothetical protein